MKEKKNSIYVRVTEKEKIRIENKAKKITLLSPFAQSVKVETEGKVYGIDLNENEITALNFPSP